MRHFTQSCSRPDLHVPKKVRLFVRPLHVRGEAVSADLSEEKDRKKNQNITSDCTQDVASLLWFVRCVPCCLPVPRRGAPALDARHPYIVHGPIRTHAYAPRCYGYTQSSPSNPHARLEPSEFGAKNGKEGIWYRAGRFESP